jgi:hypothetical protein
VPLEPPRRRPRDNYTVRRPRRSPDPHDQRAELTLLRAVLRGVVIDAMRAAGARGETPVEIEVRYEMPSDAIVLFVVRGDYVLRLPLAAESVGSAERGNDPISLVEHIRSEVRNWAYGRITTRVNPRPFSR